MGLNVHVVTSGGKPKTVLEVAMLEAKDINVATKYRGAPVVRKYGSAALLSRSIEDVNHSDFDSLLMRYREGRDEKDTGLRLISDFNKLIQWAVAHKLRLTPFKSYKCPPRKSMDDRLLSNEVLEKVVRSIDLKYKDDIPHRLVLRSLACLGLGVQEATTFNLSRVDLGHWEYVQSDKRGRGHACHHSESSPDPDQ
jgi:site-specific recombinase XerD